MSRSMRSNWLAGKTSPSDVEDLAGALGVQISLDGADAVQQLLQHPAFRGVGAHEVEDQTVFCRR